MIARILTLATCFAICSQTHAGVVTVLVNPGSQFVAQSVGEFSVGNNDMHGLKITARFADNTSEITFFDGPSGLATGTRFLLKETADTFYNDWQLTNLDSGSFLTELEIEGGAFGNTVFDLQKEFRTTAGIFTPGDPESEGTQGSEKGLAFVTAQTDLYGDIEATYHNIVRLASNADPVGDLWTKLVIKIGNGLPGGPINPGDPIEAYAHFRFQADTDVIDAATPPPVPEPSSLTLMLGLGLLGAWRGRKGFSKPG